MDISTWFSFPTSKSFSEDISRESVVGTIRTVGSENARLLYCIGYILRFPLVVGWLAHRVKHTSHAQGVRDRVHKIAVRSFMLCFRKAESKNSALRRRRDPAREAEHGRTNRASNRVTRPDDCPRTCTGLHNTHMYASKYHMYQIERGTREERLIDNSQVPQFGPVS